MEKETKSFQGRGLHSTIWVNLLNRETDNNESKLKGLIFEVKNDKDLVIQIREDYFNVYYKGGNLAKVASENSFQFDSNYFKPSIDSHEGRKNKRKELRQKLIKTRDYKAFIEKMKEAMDEYWVWLKKDLHEKDTQHKLCLCNTETSVYTIIDLEFQCSTLEDCLYHYEKPVRPKNRFVDDMKESPRFDIIAVRNDDHRLCVIELKEGTKAIYGKSGIGDHADSFEGSIGRNYVASQAFLKEMKKVIQDKKDLGLLNQEFDVSDEDPEFIYAYAFKSDEKATMKREKEAFEDEQKKSGCENYKVIYLKKGDYTLQD